MVQCALVLIEISWSLFSFLPFTLSFFLSPSWGKWLDDLRWSITRLPVTGLHGFLSGPNCIVPKCVIGHTRLRVGMKTICTFIPWFLMQSISGSWGQYHCWRIASYSIFLRRWEVYGVCRLHSYDKGNSSTKNEHFVINHYVVQNPYCCVKMRLFKQDWSRTFYGPFWKQ